MKIRPVFLTLLLLGLLSGCQMPFAPVPATPTPTESPTSTQLPTLTATLTFTPAPTQTHFLTETPTPSSTPRPTKTIPPIPPTATSPYPVGIGTSIPDPGFVEITTENTARLSLVLQTVQQNLWQTATSRDGKQLFVATNNGLLVYDKQGQQLAHWPALLTSSQPCEACLSINADGTRFAVMTHHAGKWLAQVYNVYENNPVLLLEKPLDIEVKNTPNPVHTALSPDGLLLAYGSKDGETILIDMNNSQTLVSNQGGADAAIFSPDGSYFMIRDGRQMLFWKTPIWKNPINLQLPAEDSPYTFSVDGKLLAIAQTDKIITYAMDTLRPNREIAIETPKDLKRNWQLAFLDENVLAGYSVRWNGEHTRATVEVGQWNIATGQTLQMGSSETDSPDTLSALWGANISVTVPAPGPIALSEQYDAFRFVDASQLLINSQHSACWLKLPESAATCFKDPRYQVLSSNTEAFREIPQPSTTILQNWKNETVYKMVPPYPILVVNQTGNYYLINVKDITTDVYFKDRPAGIESLPGILVTYAESGGNIVFNTRQKSGAAMISMVNKGNLNTLYQKKVDFMLDPLVVTETNLVYFLQQVVDQPQVTLKQIHNQTYQISDVARLNLPAEPETMSVSANGIFAIGMKDGSIAIVSEDGQQVATFQAIYSPISGIALTPDGRYLAVASADGIRIFAVMP